MRLVKGWVYRGKEGLSIFFLFAIRSFEIFLKRSISFCNLSFYIVLSVFVLFLFFLLILSLFKARYSFVEDPAPESKVQVGCILAVVYLVPACRQGNYSESDRFFHFSNLVFIHFCLSFSFPVKYPTSSKLCLYL